MSKTIQNFYSETVKVAWTTGTGNFYVSTKPTPTSGWLVVSPNNSNLREIVEYTAVGTDGTGDYITISNRGVGGTTEQTHAVGEPVRLNITAEYWADIYADPTLTGTVTVPTPTNSTDASTKGYVDGIAIAGSPDASTTTKGISKMSTAPASATDPIAVGDNDPRVPTQDENDALSGNNTDIAVGNGNKLVTQTGLQHNAEKYAVDVGTTDAYVITLDPIPTSYTDGMVVHFKANTINTGTTTLNVNSLGAKTIVKEYNTALADGDIKAGQRVSVIYDGTNFQMLSPVGNAPATTITNYKMGFANATSTSNVITHNLGVIPKKITISAYRAEGNIKTVVSASSSTGFYTNSGQGCAYFGVQSSGQISGTSGNIINLYFYSAYSGGLYYIVNASISSVTSTTFTLSFSTGTGYSNSAYISWEVEG